MSEKNDNISYVEIGQSGMNKGAENIAERALDGILNVVKDKYGKACVATGNAFAKYLKNSEIRYNQVKTLADLTEPRLLEGSNGIYVNVFVEYKKKKVAITTIDDLINISNNIVIIGSGGTGKSMLMRHLFVNTHHIGKYVPIMIELRKIENTERHALLDLIHSCIESFDVSLNQEQFEYSLRTGKYLFLFDGLDEVKEVLRGKTEQLIQNLSKKYPNNCYIVSSRKEGVNFNELETYTLVYACPFEKYQAVELINKLGNKDDKIVEFANLLDKELFEKHKDFASNPLLLTMMYITFMDNNMIPEHLTDFYESAYDALYKRHDANKEGLFKRDYKCKMLGEREFKDLFSYFCFQSYFAQKYEFSKEEIFHYINSGIKKLHFSELLSNAEMFFCDIKDIVCLIVEEGTKYKFAHRSFQTYFATYYTSVHVTDENQKIFFKGEIEDRYTMRTDFFYMLYQLEGERFDNNILEPGINSILEILEGKENLQIELLKIACQALYISENKIGRGINSSKHLNIPYERNVILLFEELYGDENYFDREDIKEKIINILKNEKLYNQKEEEGEKEIEIEDLFSINSVNVRNELFELLYKYFRIGELLKKIGEWKMQQTKRREKMLKNRGRAELLSLL